VVIDPSTCPAQADSLSLICGFKSGEDARGFDEPIVLRYGSAGLVWTFRQVAPRLSRPTASIWRRGLVAPDNMTGDQYDAYTIAAWLRPADVDERLQLALHPPLTASERAVAQVEEWIIGVSSADSPEVLTPTSV
jgi:hypothetical protein